MFNKARLEGTVKVVDEAIDFLNQKHVHFIKEEFCKFLDGGNQVASYNLHLEKGRECAVCLRGAFYSVCPTDDFFSEGVLGYYYESFNQILSHYFKKVFNRYIVDFNDCRCNSKDDQISALKQIKDAILADIAKQ